MIDVYWTAYAEHGTISTFDFSAPQPILPQINSAYKNLGIDQNFSICPAFTELHNNSFTLVFPNDYELNIVNDSLSSSFYDQKYYDEMVYLRSIENKLVSYNIRYLFYCDNSLEVEMLQNNYIKSEFSSNTTLIEGKFNINQWFRPLDCAFMIKDSKVKLNKNEPFAVVKFNTSKKVNLKQFYRTQDIINLQNDLYNTRLYTKKIIKPLNYFYQKYNEAKIGKLLSKHIRNSVIQN